MSDMLRRDGREILTDLLELTRSMLHKREDADFLIDAVAERQILMDEYDGFGVENPDAAAQYARDPDIRFLIEDIIAMDKSIAKALETHREQAKSDVTASNSKQKVLNYMNHAMSSSGSYMDYRK